MIQCDTEKFVKKLFGEKSIEPVLQRLNRLTEEEAKLTATQILEVVHGLVHGEQFYQTCHSLGVEYHSFQTAKHRSTVFRRPLVRF